MKEYTIRNATEKLSAGSPGEIQKFILRTVVALNHIKGKLLSIESFLLEKQQNKMTKADCLVTNVIFILKVAKKH